MRPMGSFGGFLMAVSAGATLTVTGLAATGLTAATASASTTAGSAVGTPVQAQAQLRREPGGLRYRGRRQRRRHLYRRGQVQAQGRGHGIPAYTVKVNAKFPAASPALRGVVCLHDLELLALADS